MNWRVFLTCVICCAAFAEKHKWNPETLFNSNDFSHVVTSDEVATTIFVSAQTPLAPGESEVDPTLTLSEQTKRVLLNLATALEAAGATPDDVVRVHVFVTDYQQVEGMAVGRQVRRFFDNRMPASSFIPVQSLLTKNARIQIDAVAELERK